MRLSRWRGRDTLLERARRVVVSRVGEVQEREKMGRTTEQRLGSEVRLSREMGALMVGLSLINDLGLGKYRTCGVQSEIK